MNFGQIKNDIEKDAMKEFERTNAIYDKIKEFRGDFSMPDYNMNLENFIKIYDNFVKFLNQIEIFCNSVILYYRTSLLTVIKSVNHFDNNPIDIRILHQEVDNKLHSVMQIINKFKFKLNFSKEEVNLRSELYNMFGLCSHLYLLFGEACYNMNMIFQMKEQKKEQDQ